MKKCKLIFLSTLMLILIFGTTSLASDYIFNGETIPATSSIDDDFYGVDTVTNILDDFGITYDDITKVSYTYYVNQAYKYFKENKDSTVNVMNVCFHKYDSTRLMMSFTNGSFSDTLKYMAINNDFNSEKQTINYFDSWITSNGNNVGINYIKPFLILISQNRIDTYSQTLSMKGGTENKQISASSIYYNNMLAPLKTFVIATKSPTTGYSWYFVNSTIRFSKESTTPGGGGTGGETSGDQGGGNGGGSSVDLTMTNEKIDQLNKHAEEIKNKIPTSGEIANATTQGNKDYWGNTEEMKGEDYENQINQGINDSMGKISEELEKNKIFNSIAIAEQKIIDLFLETPEDFKISWQDVKYLEKTLIPAGEINFSKMCRDNETLGKVKNTLNIIVSAMISLSLFKYIFNLIMVTLGIDHPLILESEKDDITEISSTKVGNKTYVMKKSYKSDKKGGK